MEASGGPQQVTETAQKEQSAEEGETGRIGPADDTKPVYSMGQDGRPRQRILTEQGMLLPAG